MEWSRGREGATPGVVWQQQRREEDRGVEGRGGAMARRRPAARSNFTDLKKRSHKDEQ